MSLKKPPARAIRERGGNLDLLAGACVGLGVDGLLALMGQRESRRGIAAGTASDRSLPEHHANETCEPELPALLRSGR